MMRVKLDQVRHHWYRWGVGPPSPSLCPHSSEVRGDAPGRGSDGDREEPMVISRPASPSPPASVMNPHHVPWGTNRTLVTGVVVERAEKAGYAAFHGVASMAIQSHVAHGPAAGCAGHRIR